MNESAFPRVITENRAHQSKKSERIQTLLAVNSLIIGTGVEKLLDKYYTFIQHQQLPQVGYSLDSVL